MALAISVFDKRFSGQLQQALQELRRAGCAKANTLYILTPAQLSAGGLTLHMLKVLASTSVGTVAIAVGAADAPQPPRIVARLLEDKASHEIAFQLGVDLVG